MNGSSSWAPPAAELAAFGRKSLAVGLIALVASLAGWRLAPDDFYRAWLVGWVWILSVALGALGVYLVHLLSRGAWGLVARRPLEAAGLTIPALALFAIPVLLGLGSLYPWADASRVAHDEILRHRQPWMSAPYVVVRLVLYFAIWSGLSVALSGLSRKQDSGREPAAAERSMQMLAGPGLVLHILAVSFFSFDLFMSVNPHWYSTIYGFYVLGGQAISGMALVILTELLLSSRPPLSGVLQKRHIHDHGNLLFAFLMLWGYFAVSQYLIIWSGDLPEEVVFYNQRFTGGWGAVALVVVFVHFVLPFFILLSRDLKRNMTKLSVVAALLLVMRWVDLYWLAAPAFSPGRFRLHWVDVVAPIAMGGIWLWLYAGRLASRPLLPLNDPHLPEAIAVAEAHHG
jgi:hypothetical protein